MMKGICCLLLAATCFLTILWGCVNLGQGTGRKTRFYVLRSLSGPAEKAVVADYGDGVKVGVGPVNFPEYLNRPQIITRIGANELEISEFHRWAEPLDESFLHGLGENLSVLLSTNKLFLYPRKSSTPIDYQITVEVTRFDGALGGEVTLNAVWTIYDKDGREVLMRKQGEHKEAVKADGYDALVSAHRRSLEALSRDIAAAIKGMAGRRT